MPFKSSPLGVSAPARQQPIPALDLQRQYDAIGRELLESVERVLQSQHFIGGPELEAFEQESAQYLGVAASVGCASGTDALWLALQAAGVEPGDSVITTPFSFFASASSITRCGATPVFADVDPATLNLDASQVRTALEKQPAKRRAVMPVHLYGQCADMDAFSPISREFEAPIIEDAAQGFGAQWRGVKAGALGKAAAFSFYPTKNLGAYGDAGCVTTDDRELADHVRRLRNHGSRQRYYHEEIGWNSRLDAIQAAILRVKLRHLEVWNRQRREAAARYDTMLAKSGLVAAKSVTVNLQVPIATLAVRPEAFHIYHQYVVRASRRDELRTFLSGQGIGTEIYYPLPLHLQESFAYLGYKRGDFPEAERAAAEVLALPMFPELREDEQQRVVAAIAEFYS